MRSQFRNTALSLLLISLAITGFVNPPSGYDLVKRMFNETKKIQTLSYRIRKTERINEKLVTQISTVKLSRNPYKVYSEQSYPKEGLEVLYVHGTNGNKAIINPNSFPWVNLTLDPLGSIMRKDQHHTIHNAGYDHFIDILEFLFRKYGDETASMLKLQEIEKENKDYWQLTFTNHHFKFISYTTREGESVHSIAKARRINSYTILERNPGLDHSTILEAGTILKIPNDYSPKMMLLIDKTTTLPVQITVFDDKGLFEQFEFSDLQINPSFPPSEFTTGHPEYEF